jgi:hypothetical protein
MVAKILAVAGIAGAGLYFGAGNSLMARLDPSIFPVSTDQAVAMLKGAKASLPRKDGDGRIEIWTVGKTSKGVLLNMKYASWAPVLECQAVITKVEPQTSRADVDCGQASDPSSAISRNAADLQAPMFREFVLSQLGKRPFNRANADREEMTIVAKNLPAMQREAITSYVEEQRSRAK